MALVSLLAQGILQWHTHHLHHALCYIFALFPIDLSFFLPIPINVHTYIHTYNTTSIDLVVAPSASQGYLPHSDRLSLSPHSITSPTAVKLSPIHTTTYYYYPRSTAQSLDTRRQHYITPARTPARKPAKMPGRTVDFVPPASPLNTICRPARDDERDVMQHFASHASHCPRCADPVHVYLKGGTLCDRGHA